MINSVDRVLERACASLREVIIPQLHGDHVRAQAFGIVQALEGLRLVADRAMRPLREQVAIQEAGIAEVLAVLSAHGAPVWTAAPLPADAGEAAVARDRGEAFLGTLLRFLAEHEERLPRTVREEADAILRRTIRDQLAVELRLVPKPMFTAISSGREDGAVG